MKEVIIPYKPRPLWAGEKGIHKMLDVYRFSVIVAHRRFGKTLGVINQIIKRALVFEGKDGRFSYIAPFRNQAKAIAWDYLKRYTGVIPGAFFNESELAVYLPNGSRIRIYGADNPNALRGLYFDGVAIDELSDVKAEVWGEIIRPALADRKGWAIFIGTPKGQNLFYELYQKALGSDVWYTGMFRADETGALDDDELERLRETMSDNQYRQEMLCDFGAATDDALISLDVAIGATKRVYRDKDICHAPLVYGIDVARFGDDSSVLTKRRGLAVLEQKEFSKLDNMMLAGAIAQMCERDRPDGIFIDVGGGAGVIDRLRQLGFDATEVSFGSRPIDAIRNIEGEIKDVTHGKYIAATATGAFIRKSGSSAGNATGNGSTESFEFSARNVVPTAEENRPKNVTVLYCIKAYDFFINNANIDIEKTLKDLQSKVSYSDFAQSFGENGWTKLPNGLILQWGTSDSIVTDVQVVMKFPISFNVACLNVTATMKNAIEKDDDVASRVLTYTNTSVTLRAEGMTTAKNGTRYISYFAIGY